MSPSPEDLLSPDELQAAADAARAGCVLVHDPALSILRLQGDEVRRWTNGMFTNNTRRLAPGQGNRHAWCTDRGRVQGVLDLYMTAEDTVVLVLEGVSAEDFAARFRMYLMLDDIELEDLADPDEGEARAVWTLVGPQTAAVLAAAGLSLPSSDHGHADHDGVRVLHRDRVGLGGAELLVPTSRQDALRATILEAGATAAPFPLLDALRVLAGRARWPVDGTEKSLVHELRLNEDCVAFDKGCYVGQEVINRIDVRGGVQKRLTQVELSAPTPPGTPVQRDGKELGTLTSVATLDGRTVGIGVLRKAAWEPGTELVVGDSAQGTVIG